MPKKDAQNNKMSIRGIDPEVYKAIQKDMIDKGTYANVGEWINEASKEKLKRGGK
jgi:hypothetical protein